jgi:hypothetical protein
MGKLIMKVLQAFSILAAILFCTASYAYDIAIYERGRLHLPTFKLGKHVYTNIILELGEDNLFRIKSIGSTKKNIEEVVSRYDKVSKVVNVDYMTTGENTYKNVVLQVSKGPTLKLVDSIGLFEDVKTTISTPEKYYSAVAEAEVGASLITLAVIDVNLDGLNDIVAHYWGFQSDPKSLPDVYTGPVKNNLVIYLQDETRNFQIGTREILGSDFVDLGGASRKRVIGDFNLDGYQDIAYAMNKEDGRKLANSEEGEPWATEAAILISNGDGTYRVDLLSPANFYHSVDTRITREGYIDILFNSPNFNNSPAVAYRYVNNKAELVEGYPYVSPAFSSFNKASTNGYSNQLISDIILDDQSQGIGLFEEDDEGYWQEIDQFGFNADSDYTKLTCEGCDAVEEWRVHRFNGRNRYSPAIFESCSMLINPQGESIFIVQLSSYLLPDELSDSVNIIDHWHSQREDEEFLAFRVLNSQLELIPEFFDQQDRDIHSYWFECGDIDGDGYDDLVTRNRSYSTDYSSQERGAITIYKNNKKGSLQRIDPRIIPKPTLTEFPSDFYLRALYEDLDNDGIKDVLYFADNSKVWGEIEGQAQNGFIHTPVSFYIYWGKQPIF